MGAGGCIASHMASDPPPPPPPHIEWHHCVQYNRNYTNLCLYALSLGHKYPYEHRTNNFLTIYEMVKNCSYGVRKGICDQGFTEHLSVCPRSGVCIFEQRNSRLQCSTVCNEWCVNDTGSVMHSNITIHQTVNSHDYAVCVLFFVNHFKVQ